MLTWVSAGARLAESFPGFLGAGWVRGGVDSREWHMLYRFVDDDALAGWEGSSERRWWLDGAPGTVRQGQTEKRTGIEGWFDAAAGSVVGPPPRPAPPRWRQAIVIFTVFLPLSLLMNSTLGLLLTDVVPLVVRVAAVTTALTPIMTYFGLPWATKTFAWFLHSEPPPWRRRRTS
ncbi:antibiotic biosynthesis monooxygenase [Pseudokineococcus sp. 1T1Z-3]|uniref:antibiotic biosynthesis monooxygenase n=2 Tax=Pseudokineococcus sp. 1T1Z-3 TaxID=3132745 RepID=UPI00403F4CB3